MTPTVWHSFLLIAHFGQQLIAADRCTRRHEDGPAERSRVRLGLRPIDGILLVIGLGARHVNVFKIARERLEDPRTRRPQPRPENRLRGRPDIFVDNIFGDVRTE